MKRETREDLETSVRRLQAIVWPAIRARFGGGELVANENASERTARDLDMLAGIDAYQRLPNAMGETFASRIQTAGASYDTFTVRYQRDGQPLESTEFQKRAIAVANDNTIPKRTIQAYIDPKETKLLAVGVVKTRELYRHLAECQGKHGDFGSNDRMGRSRCYYQRVEERGAARFVVVPWAHLQLFGVNVDVVRDVAIIAPYAPWTWACLPCNTTGVGDRAVHRCGSTVKHMSGMSVETARAYWTRRLTWALHGDVETAERLLSCPIERTEIAKLLGPSWGVEGDNAALMSGGKPIAPEQQ